MRIFDKCGTFTEAREAQARGIYPYYAPIEAAEPTRVRIHGEWRLMLGSNNYLGLTHHPRVVEAAAEALRQFGSGSTGSRLMNGNLAAQEELEGRLAAFLGKESAAIFPTGYAANVGTLGALGGRDDHLILDRLDHASLLDGARLSFAGVHRYSHGDLAALEGVLSRLSAHEGKLIATDGVFSMDGHMAELPALGRLAERYDAALLVDDAHGLGVLGPTGAGTAEHLGVTDRVDLIVATFSKSLGSIGGVVAGEGEVIHYLKHRARSLLFSASMPPASVAGVDAALSVIQSEPELRERLHANALHLRRGLEEAGFDIGTSETPILPIEVGNYDRVLRFWRALFDRGVYVNAVVPPGVPPDQSRLRVSLTAAHTPDELDRAIEAFAEAHRSLPLEETAAV